jgi:hypothetical protein
MAIMPAAPPKWLDVLTGATDIDPGEAQLVAMAAEAGALLLTGDKRALRSVAKLATLAEALKGVVITFEAILLRMCETMGDAAVRSALSPLAEDQLVRICFSPGNPDPKAALRSYQENLQEELRPLVLWDPATGRIE